MRHALRLLAVTLAVSSLFAGNAKAQSGTGKIYYKYNSHTELWRVNGHGTNNVLLASQGINVGTWSSYPAAGGRQFTMSGPADTTHDPIPGDNQYGDDILLLPEQQGYPVTRLTAFTNTRYLVDTNAPRIRFANGSDSFFVFLLYDRVVAGYYLVRYPGSISDFLGPSAAPPLSDADVPPGDGTRPPRLQIVAQNVPLSWGIWSFNLSGTKFTYTEADASGRKIIKLFDIPSQTSIVVNDPAISGLDLAQPWSSPTEFKFYGSAIYKDGTKGIASLDPATGAWRWVIKEGGSGPKKIWSFSQATVSPDGGTLAFGMLRIVNNNKTAASLVKVPVSGGAYTPLVTNSGTTVNDFDAGAPGWRP